MNVLCSAKACPVLLSSTCVFYEGENLIYTGINTNDNLQEALQKIDEAFGNAVLNISAVLPISITAGPNPIISISQASATSNGYISSTDWNIFNNKQNAVSLTTVGSTGPSTFNSLSGALNIPDYSVAFPGFVPTTRTLSINGTSYDLSANRTWNVGTVTSVGITMPPAFNVSNSPITSSGVIGITAAGLASQYVRGDGLLGDFPSGGGGGSAVSYYLNGSVNQGTFGGSTYYEINKTPVIGGPGTNFSITNTVGLISQFITDPLDPGLLLIPAGNWNIEFYFNSSDVTGAPYFYVELYIYNGTTFTLISSGAANPEYITNGTSVDIYFTSIAVPETIITVNDRFAIRVYGNTDGNRTITLHTEGDNLSQIVTTFSNGLTALNGLTRQVQYFATGSAGTDFAINSSIDIHTFNLPTASSTNRGALSSADWIIFNSKVGGSGAAGQVAYWTGASAQAGNNNLFWDAANSRLGIGTNAPSASLHIVKSTVNDALLIVTPNNNTSAYPFFLGGATLTADNYLRANASVIEFFRNGVAATIRTVGSSNNLVLQSSSDLLLNTNGANERVRIFNTTGNVGINTSTTDGGQRLQVYGDAFIKGSGIGSAPALAIQNNSGLHLLRVQNNGMLRLGSTSSSPFIFPITNVGSVEDLSGTNLSFYSYTGSQSSSSGRFIFGGENMVQTTGANYNIYSRSQFFPTSGTATLADIYINPQISQSGGANGITRGLYVNPTLTAAADWRSIEWSNNSGWGLYGAGTANNYLAGSLGIGTTSPSRKLHVVGTSALFQNAGAFELDLLNTTSGNYLRATAGATDANIGTIQNIPFSFTMNGARVGQFTSTNGNLILQNGGTFTDAGFRLDVQGTARVTGAATFSSSVTASSLVKSGGTSSQYLMADGSTSTLTNPVTGTGTTNFLPKWTSGSAIGNSQIFDNGTSVGINNASPSSIFVLDVNARDVSYNTRFYQPSSSTSAYNSIFISGVMTSANAYFGIGGSATGNTSFRDAVVIGSQSSHPLVFNTSDTERARFTTAGRLLLGTTTDAGYKLDVNGTARVSGQVTGDSFVPTSSTIPTNGMYLPSANTLGFASGTSSRMVITSTGAVGIGITSPLGLFEVKGDGASYFTRGTKSILLNPNVVGADTNALIEVTSGMALAFGTGGAERMRLNSSGNLGLGTTSASTRLVVSQSADNVIGFNLLNPTGRTAIFGYSSTFQLDIGANSNDNIRFGNFGVGSGILSFLNNGTEAMRITSGGNVGIGTTSPSVKLHVIGDTILQSTSTGDGTTAIRVNNSLGTQVLAIGAAGGIIMNNSTKISTTASPTSTQPQLELYNGSTGNATLQSSTSYNLLLNPNGGNVGIGTTSPSYKMHVLNSGGVTSAIEATGAGASSVLRLISPSNYWLITNDGTSANLTFNRGGTDVARFSNTGNLLVGTTADQGYRVQITGSGDNMLNVWGATAPSIRLDNAASGATQRFVLGLATATNNFIQGASAGDVCITTATASPIVFGMWQTSTASEVMRITTSNNLLVGTTVDNGQKLQVSGAILATSFVKSGGTSSQYLMADGSVTTGGGGGVDELQVALLSQVYG